MAERPRLVVPPDESPTVVYRVDDQPEEPTGVPWAPTRAMGRAVLICGVLLLTAVLLGRYDLVVLAAPFALGTAWSLARRPTGVPLVEVVAVDPRFPEGGQITAAVSVANPSRARLDLVVARLRR